MKHLTKKEKALIERFINHQLDKDKLMGSFSNQEHKYALCEDFINAPKDDIRKYHIGMQFILEMILHQLPFYPSEKEYVIEQKRLHKENARLVN